MRLPEESGSHPTERVNSGTMVEDQRLGQPVLMNHTERRKSPRTSIRRLAYVNLEPYDNGGVIADISKEGLRFHTVKPVEQGGLVRLSILLGAANQLQVVGDLIWMDATRKIGGVRFTVLPDGTADQILKWAEALNSADAFKSGTSRRSDGIPDPSIPNHASPQAKPAADLSNVAARPKPNLSAPPPAAPVEAGPEPSVRPAWVPPATRPPAGAPTAPISSRDLTAAGTERPQPWSKPGETRQPTALHPTMPWITHFDPDPPVRGSSFLRGVLGGFLLCAVFGSAAWFAVRHYGWQISPVRFGTPLALNPLAPSPLASHPDLPSSPSAELPNSVGTSTPEEPEEGQSAAQAIPPPASPNARSDPYTQLNTGAEATDNSAAGPKSAVPPEASASPRSPSPQAPIVEVAPPTTLSPAERGAPGLAPQRLADGFASQLPRSTDTGESQLMLARQYLDGHVRPRNPTVASQLLWSAVEKGNTAAEMDLADLYLHGDGVARNCDQARVLLSAASSKGNPEAMQKLSELNRTGCR